MKLMLTANDLPKVLQDFRQVYTLDTEYYSKPDFPDGPVVPVALQAYEVLSGEWTSLFFGQAGATYENPLDPDALYLTFNAAAEWNCFLSLGWKLPRNCIDFYIEFKNEISALKPPPQFQHPRNRDKWKSSLLDVVKYCGFPARSPEEKKQIRERILLGHPFSNEERDLVLSYCRDDVIDTALVAKILLPRISSAAQAILRAHFMRPVAKIQRAGIPIDAKTYAKLLENRDALKLEIVSQLGGTALNIYEGTTLK